MAPFLSDEWFSNLESIVNGVTIGTSDDPGLALGQVINDAPGGTISYTLVLGGGRSGRLIRDSVETASVALVEDYASAQAIIAGASVADLLAGGKIKVRGDFNALLGASAELQALAQILGAVTEVN